MKKLYLSSLLFSTMQSLFLLHPIATHCGTLPVESNKKLFMSKYEDTQVQNRHRVWLNLTSKEGIFKQLLIGYTAGATNGWDYAYDAVSMDAYKPADFYSINEGKKLTIQGRALPFELSDIIQLGYRSAVTGDLTISIDHADGDLTNQAIYLLDKQTGKMHNLRNGGYTFSTVIGIFNNRFEIRYTEETQKLGTPEFTSLSPELTVASKNKIISLKSQNQQLKEVSIFDITGKMLYSNHPTGTSDLEINTIQGSVQILLVKTILENGNTITKKVFF
ncbi:T9SS sorting signal type C domain-containing protein [Flavobacterium panacagri]|uniref:T9SS sorting signal type C domain-containing protein n=1 Tax=Flavobacterium panacagri TaxID=3034146 RepID=UPI0025A553D5|nr:T9SS sorting signal type C domain-containing protein [Flavobacterium panacagri]